MRVYYDFIATRIRIHVSISGPRSGQMNPDLDPKHCKILFCLPPAQCQARSQIQAQWARKKYKFISCYREMHKNGSKKLKKEWINNLHLIIDEKLFL